MRRVFMWLAVASLCGIALLSGLTFVLIFRYSSGGGWSFYSPRSSPSPTVMEAIVLCSQAYRIMVPLAALTCAAYILLVERALRLTIVGGFEVLPGAPTEMAPRNN